MSTVPTIVAMYATSKDVKTRLRVIEAYRKAVESASEKSSLYGTFPRRASVAVGFLSEMRRLNIRPTFSTLTATQYHVTAL